MKILVSAALTTIETDWYKLYPVYINNRADFNSKDILKNVLTRDNNQTAFIHFANLEAMIGKNKGIIFTIPQKLSGEYDALKNYNKDSNILIISGECLIANPKKVHEIISKYNDLKIIEKHILALNADLKMHAIAWNLRNLPRQKRLQNIIASILHKTGFKVILNWNNGTWEKGKIGRNGWKLMMPHLKDKKELNVIIAHEDNPYFNQIKQKCQKYFPDLKIMFRPMTNATIAHVGTNFLTFY